MRSLRLAFLMLARDWHSGELRVLFAALVIAVGAVSGVAFFTDRIEIALQRQASHLIGADLVLRADHLPDGGFVVEARRLGLKSELTLTFPSMVSHGEASQLSEIKAVGDAYPLRGSLRVSGVVHATGNIPQPGAAWLDERLMSQLGLKVGDRIEAGHASFLVMAVLAEEPDRAGDFFHIAPRLLINRLDVPATGLVQEGSRVAYRLLLAGNEKALAAFRRWAESRLGRGEKLEGLAEARPEVRTALERTQRYLGLSALMSVVLAGVAVTLAVRRFVARHLDSCAVMRCLGASQRLILQMYLWHFLCLGLAAGMFGVALGYAAHAFLAQWLASLVSAPLPPPGWFPAVLGMVTGLALLLGFAMPPLLRLGRVPTLRVLRRELGPPSKSGLLGFALSIAVLAALLVRQAGDLRLGLWVLLVLAVATLLAWFSAWLAARSARLLQAGAGASWRYGVANIGRRSSGSAAQIAAFSLAGMALLALTVVRGDLMDSWLAKISPQAPNRFVINIQPDQVAPLQRFFTDKGNSAPDFFPMVRGRLVAINSKPVSPSDYSEERGRHLVEREFNLSWAAMPQQGNRLVAGQWWQRGAENTAQFSVEQGIAQTLNIHLGDTLTYDIAGKRVTAQVSNLRQVEWDSFRVNFFVVASPGLLEQSPASYITSFYLPTGDSRLTNEMVRSFPNLTVIDVAAVVDRVRGLMDKAAQAMEFVFLFMLAAGMTVLYAAIAASSDERMFETAVWRTLGATRKQMLASVFAEFTAIGLLAGIIAALGAAALQYAVGEQVLHLPVQFNYWALLGAPLVSALLLGTAGILGVRRLINEPPLAVLHRV
jgi:putative ABC transport system permease protein